MFSLKLFKKKMKRGEGAVLPVAPWGQYISPFHCSMVCSLSSSCLSEIWGGGCETKGSRLITDMSSISFMYLGKEKRQLNPPPHRVCL